MTTAAQLDFAIAGARLNERIARYRQERYDREIGERADALWSRKLAEAADVERARWRGLVLGGGVSCSSCGEPIAPEDRWIADGVGPEHARCCIDGRSGMRALT